MGNGLTLSAFAHIVGSFGISGKAFPEEVNIEGADLVLISYPLPAALAWAGREGAAAAWSSPGSGDE